MSTLLLRSACILIALLASAAAAAPSITPASAATKCGPTNSSATATGVSHSASASVEGQLGGNTSSGPTFSKADAYGTGIGSDASASGATLLYSATSNCTFPRPANANLPPVSIGCEDGLVALQDDDVAYDGAIFQDVNTGEYWWKGTATRGEQSEQVAYPAPEGLTFSRTMLSAVEPEGLQPTPLAVHALFAYDANKDVFSCSATGVYAG